MSSCMSAKDGSTGRTSCTFRLKEKLLFELVVVSFIDGCILCFGRQWRSAKSELSGSRSGARHVVQLVFAQEVRVVEAGHVGTRPVAPKRRDRHRYAGGPSEEPERRSLPGRHTE